MRKLIFEDSITMHKHFNFLSRQELLKDMKIIFLDKILKALHQRYSNLFLRLNSQETTFLGAVVLKVLIWK